MPLDAERSQHRPARRALVGDRGAEEGHEPVPEGSGDRALEAVHLAERQAEEARQQRVHCLRAETPRERPRGGDVAAEHGDGAPLPLVRGTAAQRLAGAVAVRVRAEVDGRGRRRCGTRRQGGGLRAGDRGPGLDRGAAEPAGRGAGGAGSTGARGPWALRGRPGRRLEARQVSGRPDPGLRQASGRGPLRALPAPLQGLQGAHTETGPLGQGLLSKPGSQPVPAQPGKRRNRRAVSSPSAVLPCHPSPPPIPSAMDFGARLAVLGGDQPRRPSRSIRRAGCPASCRIAGRGRLGG